jgi:hypothetical protein
MSSDGLVVAQGERHDGALGTPQPNDFQVKGCQVYLPGAIGGSQGSGCILQEVLPGVGVLFVFVAETTATVLDDERSRRVWLLEVTAPEIQWT